MKISSFENLRVRGELHVSLCKMTWVNVLLALLLVDNIIRNSIFLQLTYLLSLSNFAWNHVKSDNDLLTTYSTTIPCRISPKYHTKFTFISQIYQNMYHDLEWTWGHLWRPLSCLHQLKPVCIALEDSFNYTGLIYYEFTIVKPNCVKRMTALRIDKCNFGEGCPHFLCFPNTGRD